MKEKKIVFLGTPSFAACVLEGLIEAKYNIVAVITQPDKEVGRKKILTPTPVKEVALAHNILVYQPISLRKDYQFLIDLKPDMLITTAYGQILPQAVLDIATINNINVHASLLPRLRGGAPIHRAIINGEKETGITIMEMVDKMDAGRMYAKAVYPINDEINTTELFDELKYVGRDLLLSVLPDLLENKLEGEVQDENDVTYGYNIKREEEQIDFNKPMKEVSCLIRGLAMIPGAYAFLQKKTFKIFKAKVGYKQEDDTTPGTLIVKDKKHLYVKCLDGYLELLLIQQEGKKITSVVDFLNGANVDHLVLNK